MKKTICVALVMAFFAGLLIGCAGQSSLQGAGAANDTQAPDPKGAEAESADSQTNETLSEAAQTTENPDNVAVVLKVYSEASATDEGNPGTEYQLSAEEADFVEELFCSSEMKLIESPLLSIGSIELRIGEEVLSTSMGNLPVLDGVVGNHYVMVELSDSECQKLKALITSHVGDLTLVP
ncbi:MAG: hypothetical protein J5878_00080 [Oscillospiraceae bacterium]|nr:hypothetical protein [Oscillospiraceae bacterium]